MSWRLCPSGFSLHSRSTFTTISGQLAFVVDVCKRSRSLSDAGRTLFGAPSRPQVDLKRRRSAPQILRSLWCGIFGDPESEGKNLKDRTCSPNEASDPLALLTTVFHCSTVPAALPYVVETTCTQNQNPMAPPSFQSVKLPERASRSESRHEAAFAAKSGDLLRQQPSSAVQRGIQGSLAAMWRVDRWAPKPNTKFALKRMPFCGCTTAVEFTKFVRR